MQTSTLRLVLVFALFAPAPSRADEKPGKAAVPAPGKAAPAEGDAPKGGRPDDAAPPRPEAKTSDGRKPAEVQGRFDLRKLEERKAAEPVGPAAPAVELPARFGGTGKVAAYVPPMPPAELAGLQFLVGNFVCEGTAVDLPGLPEHRYKARLVARFALDKFFVGYRYDQLKAKDHPYPVAQEGTWGYDVGLKRFVFTGADNIGAAFLLRGEPPTDDKLVFKGNATARFGSGRTVPVSFTFSRTEKGFDVLFEGSDPDGQVVRERVESCVRSGKQP